MARHTEFIGHVATLVSGRTVAALIGLVTMPIIARLFTPADFGVAAAFVSITGIVSHTAALRYEMALVLPKDDAEAATLLAFTYRILLCLCLGLLLIIAALELGPAHVPAMDLLGAWVWLLPASVLLRGAHEVQESWLTRTKAFHVTSVSLVAGNATTGGARIGFGALFGSSVFGLIVGYVGGLICRLAVQQAAASSVGFRAIARPIGWPAIREIARRYQDFPKLSMPAGLVYTLGQNLPVLLFGTMFSPAVAGYYAMAQQLSGTPITIVANSLRRVFLQKAAAITHRGASLRKAYLLATGGLALLGALPLACLWLVGQPLLVWLLGDDWTTAGRYLEIMALALFMVWVAAPANSVFVVLREQKLWLRLQTVLTVLRLGALGLAHALAKDPEWALQAFVAVTVVGYAASMLTAYWLIAARAALAADSAANGVAPHDDDDSAP